MRFANWFSGRARIFGISAFKGDELEIIFLEEKKGRLKLLGKEVLTKGREGLSEVELKSFRSRLESYRVRSPIWIHVLLRSVAVVKVFSLPNVSREEMEGTLTDRIHQEVPYLSEDAVLHYRVQETKPSGSGEVLLYGVSKPVIAEHMAKLESSGIVPDQTLLSTDLLRWYYQTEIVPARRALGSAVLIHWFDHQVELLFFDGHTLIQSNWARAELGDRTMTTEAIGASFALFQREWQRKPQTAFLLGRVPQGAEALIPDPAVQVERIPTSQDPGIFLPPLAVQAVRLYRTDKIFDFSLPEFREVRHKRMVAGRRTRLASSIVWFATSIFLLGLIPVTLILGTMAWYKFQAERSGQSVKEVKEIRQKALVIQSFYEKKSTPILLLEALRRAIPERVFLRELQYQEAQAKLAIRGIAPDQSQVDQFVSSLEQNPLFKRLSLQTVLAERDEQGVPLYRFSIEGSLKNEIPRA
ncbi:MAG: PilN domain-containing protein [Candidatus Omnitrophica bacterium]|nr:PilN domain-containing protein [Candidatus Omnitrophota bacterium]